MDTDDVFKHSYERILGSGSYRHDFIDSFYAHFTGQSDAVAQRFENTDMSAQKIMLHDSLDFMVDYCRTGKASPYLEKIAAVHGAGQLKIPAAMYTLWLDSLVQAVRDCDPQFDESVEQAWRQTFQPGIDFMVKGGQ